MWQRVNLWIGHDYFYDAEAVRVLILLQPWQRAHAVGQPQKVQNSKDLRGKDEMLLHADRSKSQSDRRLESNLRNVWTIPTQGVSSRPLRHLPRAASRAMHPRRN